MSDVTATNCGCGCDSGCNNTNGISNSIFGENCGCSILWILLLSSLCGGNGSFLSNGCGCDGGNSCWLIILLLLFCNGNGCGCGNY